MSKLHETSFLHCNKTFPIYIQTCLNQHTDIVNSIKVDEKSNKLISASEDLKIKVWDLNTGKCLRTLTGHHGHQDWVTSLFIIPNNKFISGSWDTTVKLWDLATYKCLKTYKNESEVWSLCLISDNQIACGCVDGTINIWNLDNSIKVKIIKAHDDWVVYLYLVDKCKLISCSGDKKIKIWNLEKFECIKVLEGYSSKIACLELTSNGNILSCSGEKTVRLWRIETGEIIKTIQFDHPVYSVKILNEDLIAAALPSGQIQIYNLSTMKQIKTIDAHLSTIYHLHFVSPSGCLLSSSATGEIKLWKIFE